MRSFLVALFLLGSSLAGAGEIEYELLITKVVGGYVIVEDPRRQETFNLNINCDTVNNGQIFLTPKAGGYRRYSLNNFLKEAGISCYHLAENIKNTIDIDDVHVYYDAGNLVVNKITAVPKEKK
jgi:hypothetical protein